jgi:hypothetical protein
VRNSLACERSKHVQFRFEYSVIKRNKLDWTGRGEKEEKQAERTELSNEVPRLFYLSIVERRIRRKEETRQRMDRD